MELVLTQAQGGLKQEQNNDTLDSARLVAAKCKCLPACTSIEYEAETSQADYDWQALFQAFRLPPEEDNVG